MANIQTGRTLSVTIDSVAYSAQVAEVTLEPSTSTEQYVTLTSSAAIASPTTWTLNVRAYQDWNAAGSFCDAMWLAASTGTNIPFVMGVSGGGTFSGDIVPAYPTAGGPADGALEVDFSFAVSGDVTYA